MTCPRGSFVRGSDIDQRIEERVAFFRARLEEKGRYPKTWRRPDPPQSRIVTVGARALILGPNGKPMEVPR